MLIDNNKFFYNLNEIPKNIFLMAQIDFIHAVNYWSSILALLISRLKKPYHRTIILDNLYDEHGNGNISKNHVYTYYDYLCELGYKGSVNNLLNRKCHSRSVNKFIERLDNCMNKYDAYEVCFILGNIEKTYIEISKKINEYLRKNNLKVHHYTEHEILDIKHAEDLFTVAKQGDNKNVIKLMDEGYDIINTLYEDLYDEYVL